MKKILLVDGHNLLFKMFYGMPSRIIGKKGSSIQAVIGFVGALLRIIRMFSPSNVIVIFDSEAGSDRATLNSDYKANRVDYTDVEDEFNPYSQLDDIVRALDQMSILNFESRDGLEADDVIASYCLNAEATSEVIIMSTDTDFIQLINDNTSLLKYSGKNSRLIRTEDIIEQFDISPSYFADYKALVGDRSDNLKGVPKIGKKTASKLINQYGSINEILENIEDISPEHIRISLFRNSENLLKEYSLIQLSRSISQYTVGNDSNISKSLEVVKTMDILREIDVI